MKLPEIVAISGTNGAGKDTLGELLAERCHYKFVSLSDIMRAHLTEQGIPHEREHMRALSTKWHREHGAGHLSRKTIDAYLEEQEEKGFKGLAIGSVRRSSEAAVIHDEGGVIVWVDADRRVRYERLQAASRGRSEDMASFEEWSKQEDVEMTPIDNDPAALDMAGVRDLADITIINEFPDQQAYKDYLIKEYEL